jgi:hypothetical protein
MKTLRKLRNQAPKHVVRRPRREFDVSDATMEPANEPAPEAVFDRITGPYGRRYMPAYAVGFDEET